MRLEAASILTKKVVERHKMPLFSRQSGPPLPLMLAGRHVRDTSQTLIKRQTLCGCVVAFTGTAEFVGQYVRNQVFTLVWQKASTLNIVSIFKP